MAIKPFIDISGLMALPFPPFLLQANSSGAVSNPATVGTIDASAEQYAFIGPLIFSDQGAGGSATLNTSSSIEFRAGTWTLADGTTSIDIGIQDVDPDQTTYPVRPDGTFDVKGTITSAYTEASTAWNSLTFSTGSKEVTHGQLVAIVWDMTARGGSDSLIIAGVAGGNQTGLGGSRTFLSSTWAVANGIPLVVLRPGGSDTRLISVPGVVPYTTQNITSVNDGSTNDEIGNIFQVPFAMRTRSFWWNATFDSLSSDFDIAVYADPLGTPTVLATATTIDASQWAGHNVGRPGVGFFSSEMTLKPNTNYAIAIRAKGASSSHDVQMSYADVSTADHRKFWPCGETAYAVQRNNGSGAFSAVSSTTRLYALSVIPSGFDDGVTSPGPTYALGI